MRPRRFPQRPCPSAHPGPTRLGSRRSRWVAAALGWLGVGLAWTTGCAAVGAASDPGRRSAALEQSRLDVVRQYEVERARLAARQEREHAHMEMRHEAEASALDAALVTSLNASGRDLRELEARLEAERRVFLADARARLRMIDARVEQLVETGQFHDGFIQRLEELGVQRAAIEIGLHALDLVTDASWLEARRLVSNEIGDLARRVESLDDTAL